MRRPVAFVVLLVSAALARGDGARDLPPPEPTYAFADLTPAQAKRLDGKTVTLRIVLDSTARDHEGQTLYDCDSPDDVSRTVWFARGVNLDDEDKPLVVRGRLQIIEHPAATHGGEFFVGFTEYRLVGARIVP